MNMNNYYNDELPRLQHAVNDARISVLQVAYAYEAYRDKDRAQGNGMNLVSDWVITDLRKIDALYSEILHGLSSRETWEPMLREFERENRKKPGEC